MASALCGELPTCFDCYEWTHHERVNVVPHEAVYCLSRRVHDGFVFVEARVQNHRRPRAFAKGFDQIVVSSVLLPRNSMQTPGGIFVADRGEGGAFFRLA